MCGVSVSCSIRSIRAHSGIATWTGMRQSSSKASSAAAPVIVPGRAADVRASRAPRARARRSRPPPATAAQARARTEMSYYIAKTVVLPFDTVIAEVTERLKAEGFGVLK